VFFDFSTTSVCNISYSENIIINVNRFLVKDACKHARIIFDVAGFVMHKFLLLYFVILATVLFKSQ
jgi:hypothetical protein